MKIIIISKKINERYLRIIIHTAVNTVVREFDLVTQCQHELAIMIMTWMYCPCHGTDRQTNIGKMIMDCGAMEGVSKPARQLMPTNLHESIECGCSLNTHAPGDSTQSQ